MMTKEQLQQTDAGMIELLKKGSDRERTLATNYLYKRFYEGLKWYFLKRLSNNMKDNATNADDLSISTMTKAFENIELYEPSQGAFSTWLYRIGLNLMIDHIRRTKAKSRPLFQEQRTHSGDEEAVQVEALSHYLDPLQSLERKERKEIIVAIMETSLTKSEAYLVRLRYMQELKYEEIATRTGKPLGSIKGELNRLKHKLQNIAA